MATYLAGNISVLAAPSPSNLLGMFVSSNTGAGTVAIFDAATSTVFSPAVIQSFTPPNTATWYPFGSGSVGMQCKNGINVSISASTMTWTLLLQ